MVTRSVREGERRADRCLVVGRVSEPDLCLLTMRHSEKSRVQRPDLRKRVSF